MELDVDKLCRTHTAFSAFDELLNAAGGYRPSIYYRHLPVFDCVRSELQYLADAYDIMQELRGDSRRAFSC